MNELPAFLNREEARSILEDPASDALLALLSTSAFIGDDILDDEDGQPMLEEELREMLDAEHVRVAPENVTKVCGLLHAISGDEFLEDVIHFLRITGAIVEGDIYAYEDDQEEPTLADIFWTFYQINLVAEDNLIDELGGRVQRYLTSLAEEEAEDKEALEEWIAQEGAEPEDLQPYVERELVFRRRRLAKGLSTLGCKPEWVSDLDPELAELML